MSGWLTNRNKRREGQKRRGEKSLVRAVVPAADHNSFIFIVDFDKDVLTSQRVFLMWLTIIKVFWFTSKWSTTTVGFHDHLCFLPFLSWPVHSLFFLCVSIFQDGRILLLEKYLHLGKSSFPTYSRYNYKSISNVFSHKYCLFQRHCLHCIKACCLGCSLGG